MPAHSSSTSRSNGDRPNVALQSLQRRRGRHGLGGLPHGTSRSVPGPPTRPGRPAACRSSAARTTARAADQVALVGLVPARDGRVAHGIVTCGEVVPPRSVVEVRGLSAPSTCTRTRYVPGSTPLDRNRDRVAYIRVSSGRSFPRRGGEACRPAPDGRRAG